MPRIRLLTDKAELPPDQHPEYDRIVEILGRVGARLDSCVLWCSFFQDVGVGHEVVWASVTKSHFQDRHCVTAGIENGAI